MTKIAFSKYSGCGNDFILIDNRIKSFPEDPLLYQKLCARNTGIGADGIIFVEKSTKADFRVRIFNSDGSEAEMCGNGMRCYGKFLHDLHIPGKKFRIEAKEREISIELLEDHVKIGMGKPCNFSWDLKLQVDNQPFILDYLDTGVPHAIHFVNDIHKFDLLSLGPKVRHHPHFQPKGTNFNVASVAGNQVWLRTYERGVENETLACGTGAAAVALAASKRYGIHSPISVHTRSGEKLEIGFNWNATEPAEVTATGPANFVFRGEIAI